MRNNGTRKTKSEAEELADDVRLLNPIDATDAYQKALSIIAKRQPEVSGADIFDSHGSTWVWADKLAKEVAAILFPSPNRQNA